MAYLFRRKFRTCRELTFCTLVILTMLYIGDAILGNLSNLSESVISDLDDMAREGSCLLHSRGCSSTSSKHQPPAHNISRILADKFSPNSRHRLRYQLRNDDVISSVEIPRDNALCETYARDWERTWTIVRNVFGAFIADPQGITLVTQLSLDRLAPFQHTLKHWNGAVSVSIYFPEERTMDFLTSMTKMIGLRTNVFVHVVFQGKEHFYPGNMLRNVAAQNVETEFVFLIDGDFAPNIQAERKLKRHRWKLQQRQVYIAPAFAFVEQPPTSVHIKSLLSKEHLLHGMAAPVPHIQTFEQYSYRPGHRNTNYTKWASATITYEVAYELGFEPYVLMFGSDMVHYPESFLGLMHDKSSFFTVLKLEEFTFHVLPDVYLIHFAHDRVTINKEEKECLFLVFRAWRHRMFVLYGVDPLHWKAK